MSLKIIPMHETLLTEVCQPLAEHELNSAVVQKNIQEMLKIYYDNPAVGMAAPQVGWNARVFVMGIDKEHDPKGKGFPVSVFINPQYEVIDAKTELDWEGCFSVFNEPMPHLHGQVARPKGIRYQALNEKGEAVSGELTGYYARVFQHEYDHLDGIRFVNRMANGNSLFYQDGKDEYKIYMHQLPKILQQKAAPSLRNIVPLLKNAPLTSISKKLLQEIIVAAG